jgi:hypothetical protein
MIFLLQWAALRALFFGFRAGDDAPVRLRP